MGSLDTDLTAVPRGRIHEARKAIIKTMTMTGQNELTLICEEVLFMAVLAPLSLFMQATHSQEIEDEAETLHIDGYLI